MMVPSNQSIKQNKYSITGLHTYMFIFLYSFHIILYNFLAKVKANIIII